MTAVVLHPRAVAALTPEKPALIMAESGESLSYARLVERADRTAQLMRARGLETGDTIALLLGNCIEYAELCWAAKNSGLHYVAVSSHLNAVDIAFILADCGASLVVVSAELLPVARDALQGLPGLRHRLVLGAAAAGFDSYEAESAKMPAIPPDRPRGASMLYSSGTTGRPKGVRFPLTGGPPTDPSARHRYVARQYGFGPETVFLSPGPLYHAGPLRFMMMVQREGGTVIGFRKFDAAGFLRAVTDHRATHGFVVPTMFNRLLRLPKEMRERADVGSLRCIIHGAAPCAVETKLQMIAWWGPIIEELYSGTEAVGHTFIGSAEWLAHPGSVGRPPAECRIKIVDAHGAALPPGQPGRIMMCNGRRFAYHNDAEKTDRVYDGEGYASLGDIGYLDEEGYLYLTDRESHMIISGGVNIYPREAEAVLATHPEIEDVAVIGVPDADLGEAAKAIVQPVAMPADSEALAADILAFCRVRLSAIKCPRSVEFVKTLPRNELGKLAKHSLRAPYWAGLGRSI